MVDYWFNRAFRAVVNDHNQNCVELLMFLVACLSHGDGIALNSPDCHSYTHNVSAPIHPQAKLMMIKNRICMRKTRNQSGAQRVFDRSITGDSGQPLCDISANATT